MEPTSHSFSVAQPWQELSDDTVMHQQPQQSICADSLLVLSSVYVAIWRLISAVPKSIKALPEGLSLCNFDDARRT